MRVEFRTLDAFYELESEDVFAKCRPFSSYLQALKNEGSYPYRRTLLTPCANRVVIRDPLTSKPKEMVMMASNNYLGLTTHPKVIEAGRRALEEYGTGSGGVPLLSGTYELHRALERRIARFKGCEDAVVFPTGYSTNVGCINALIRPKDIAINDRLNHASLIDGCRLSRGTLRIFRHNDMESLRRVLEYAKGRFAGKLIIVDGVFSMDGDIARLPEIISLARQYGARVMVDEAHATGVIGKNGRGTPEHFNLEGQVDIVAGTLSKALGGLGGFVASSQEVVDYVRFYARAYMFSTSLPPVVAASVLAAIDVIEEEPERRARLHDNIGYMLKHLKALGFNTGNTETAIVPLIIGDDAKVKDLTLDLHQAGIYVNPVFYPAVPKGTARIRLSLMATHTKQDLDQALDALETLGRKHGII